MTPMERAARALYVRKFTGNSNGYWQALGIEPYPSWDEMDSLQESEWLEQVKTVLKSMREPDEKMIEVGGEKVFSGSRSAATVGVKHAWQAMIDAAMGE